MTRVDFYVLSQPGERARQIFACRLAEKAYRLDNTVYIHTGDHAAAEQIDELLWTFRDGSFVPHTLSGAGNFPSSVTVGCEWHDVAPRDLLINLDDDIPDCVDAFPRIAELVSSDEECRRCCRKRFAAYRDRGHELEMHKV